MKRRTGFLIWTLLAAACADTDAATPVDVLGALTAALTASPPAIFGQISLSNNGDGRLEAFYLEGTSIHHDWQIAPNGGWHGDSSLGGFARQIAVGQNQDGRLELFYVGTNDALYHNSQASTHGGWLGEFSLGDSAQQIAVGQNQDGRLELAYIGLDDALYHEWQLAPNGAWSAPAAFGGDASQMALGRNQDGRLELFYRGIHGGRAHDWQLSPNSGWSGQVDFPLCTVGGACGGCDLCNDGQCICARTLSCDNLQGSVCSSDLCSNHGGVDPDIGCTEQ